jgi:phosphoribosylanthranilate isomerase
MRTRIKVCCIASALEARMAIAAGADAIGLLAAMPSGPEALPDALIANLAAFVPPPISTFLLTAEITAKAISDHIVATGPGVVQILSLLHPEEAAELARLQPHVKRVQVIHVESARALELISVYAPHVDAFLLDSARPGAEVTELPGAARTDDWFVSAEFVKASPRAVFLGGGLDIANVGEAIAQVQPFGIDVCSGVRSGGKLDAFKLAEFVSAVRRADQALSYR